MIDARNEIMRATPIEVASQPLEEHQEILEVLGQIEPPREADRALAKYAVNNKHCIVADHCVVCQSGGNDLQPSDSDTNMTKCPDCGASYFWMNGELVCDCEDNE